MIHMKDSNKFIDTKFSSRRLEPKQSKPLKLRFKNHAISTRFSPFCQHQMRIQRITSIFNQTFPYASGRLGLGEERLHRNLKKNKQIKIHDEFLNMCNLFGSQTSLTCRIKFSHFLVHKCSDFVENFLADRCLLNQQR